MENEHPNKDFAFQQSVNRQSFNQKQSQDQLSSASFSKQSNFIQEKLLQRNANIMNTPQNINNQNSFRNSTSILQQKQQNENMQNISNNILGPSPQNDNLKFSNNNISNFRQSEPLNRSFNNFDKNKQRQSTYHLQGIQERFSEQENQIPEYFQEQKKQNTMGGGLLSEMSFSCANNQNNNTQNPRANQDKGRLNQQSKKVTFNDDPTPNLMRRNILSTVPTQKTEYNNFLKKNSLQPRCHSQFYEENREFEERIPNFSKNFELKKISDPKGKQSLKEKIIPYTQKAYDKFEEMKKNKSRIGAIIFCLILCFLSLYGMRKFHFTEKQGFFCESKRNYVQDDCIPCPKNAYCFDGNMECDTSYLKVGLQCQKNPDVESSAVIYLEFLNIYLAELNGRDCQPPVVVKKIDEKQLKQVLKEQFGVDQLFNESLQKTLEMLFSKKLFNITIEIDEEDRVFFSSLQYMIPKRCNSYFTFSIPPILRKYLGFLLIVIIAYAVSNKKEYFKEKFEKPKEKFENLKEKAILFYEEKIKKKK